MSVSTPASLLKFTVPPVLALSLAESPLSAAADVPDPLLAPLSPGKAAGQLRMTLGDKVIATYPWHPSTAVSEAGCFGRLADNVKLWMN